MNLHLYSALSGDHYVRLFKNACFRSLVWPKNYEAIRGLTWNIFTRPEHFDELTRLFKGYDFKLNLIQMGDTQLVAGCGEVLTKNCDYGVILLNGLRSQIGYGLKNQSKMLLCPPDTIFGDGSIANILKLGSAHGVCVSVAHMRVLPSILDEIEILGATRGALTNPQLVTLSMNHAHDSWKHAEVGHDKNTSFSGGISWSRLGAGLYSVTHRLPTPYFVDFNTSDWDFFWGQVSWGGWDHRWPAENLIRQERQRYVGSSDGAFIVEVTDWDKNIPPSWDVPDHLKLVPDRYWNNHYHNSINRQTNVIFRGE